VVDNGDVVGIVHVL